MKHLSAIFLKGLFAILPLTVTLLLIYWLGLAAEETLGGLINWFLPEGLYVPGMGVAAGLGLIFLVGLLVNLWGVPQLMKLAERIVDRIPLVKTIYGSVRDLLGFFSRTEDRMSKVGIVRLGNTGVQMVCLITREQFDDLPIGLGGEGLVAVYVPYSYQIGGFTLIVPRDHVQPLDMSLEDAMRFVVTAGVKAGKG
ncbi:MAG TPA: DUF502 domain-containing protein [Phycisphaerales bacterium]|nr:DUF502 domain-containing protein [Phycisphaerales bacterium]